MTIDETEQRLRVAVEARTWLGTPYHHHARIKGERGGVDCAQILCAVYETAGVIGRVDPGFYPHDHHLHRTEEIYIQWLERCGAREVQTPALGDVALFHWGHTWSHGGIVVDTQPVAVVHSYLGHGVCLTRLADEAPLAGRRARYWSLWA